MLPRPGIAKVRRARHVTRLTKSFVRTLPAGVGAWLEQADVVSEGEVRADEVGAGATYFGSSSIALAWESAPDETLSERAAWPALESDPHLRVGALRIARREAEARAGGDLSTMRADLDARAGVSGVVLTIDVEARVITNVKVSRK